MPKIDFYLLNSSDKQQRYRFVCRLVEKAYQQNNTVYLYVDSLEDAQHLDDLLWTFRDTSFIPHGVDSSSDTPNDTLSLLSIRIGTAKPKHFTAEVLFNLTQQALSFISEFSRIIEVIPEEKITRLLARKKYKIYKEQNCLLTTHTINLTC